MLAVVQRLVQSFDSLLARAYLSACTERSGLITLLFHSVFRDATEIEQNHIDPLQKTTVDQLDDAIVYYLQNGYQFISPNDLVSGVTLDGKYVQLTFDDGYYNNIRALSLLEKYNVPAVVFVSTDHVIQNKCFWWDVLYRERLAEGASRHQIYNDGVKLKQLRTEAIELQLCREFGRNAFQPRGDMDRPFTPDELRIFSAHPLISIGNHTANHAILTHYDDDSLYDQLQRCQQSLFEITGTVPVAIAYPNGGYDSRVIKACRGLGLNLGYTTEPAKLPATSADLLRIGRFAPGGSASIRSQCHAFRSDLNTYHSLRSFYLSTFRPRGAA